MIKPIRDTFNGRRDVHKGGNNQRCAVADAALSAFSVFFTQMVTAETVVAIAALGRSR